MAAISWLCFDESHDSLTRVQAARDDWKEFGKLELPEKSKTKTIDNKIWTHPVVAHGTLYLRHHDLLFCFKRMSHHDGPRDATT